LRVIGVTGEISDEERRAWSPGDLARILQSLRNYQFPLWVTFDRLKDEKAEYLGRAHPIIKAFCQEVISRAVSPSRTDIANQELVEAHLYSVWLAILGLVLGHSMADLRDLEAAGYPLLSEKVAALKMSEDRQLEAVTGFTEQPLTAPGICSKLQFDGRIYGAAPRISLEPGEIPCSNGMLTKSWG